MASFPNIYTHRKVADTAAKPCEVCYKPSSSVLITPENKDFFYVCPGHLKDRAFCSPIIDQAAIDAKKKKEMDEEVQRLKKEYEEKQRKKKEEEAEKDKEKDQDKDKDKDKDKAKDNNKDKDKAGDDKKEDGKADDKDKSEEKDAPKPEPRVFALHRTFYQQRIDKKRQAEMARRNRERLQDPNYFPSVPSGKP